MIEHYYHTLEGENWFDYEEVYKAAVDAAKDGSVFVEVGSWRGKSACFMGVEIINSGKSIKLYCVDNWSQGDTKKDFLSNTENVKDVIRLVEGISWEMASCFDNNSVDFCFIDASHDYYSKKRDIEAWLPKIKIGGTIGGHDYTPNMDKHNQTYDAVNDVLGEENIFVTKNVWLYYKK